MSTKLIQGDNRWELKCSYDDRSIAQDAGFRWDRDDKVWYTKDPEAAKEVIGYADSEVEDSILSAEIVEEEVEVTELVENDSVGYIFRCSFDEKQIAKDAGFRWNSKNWHTKDPKKAFQLVNYASDELKSKLTQTVDAKNAHASESLELSSAAISDLEIPSPDGLDYLPYQKAGIAYALGRKNTLIGDDMGLGKTIQAVGVANAIEGKKILIICPASLRLNWQAEYQKWDTKNLSVGVVVGSRWTNTDVVVINYDILGRHASALRDHTWDLMVIDEAHYLKTPKAARTKAVFGDKDLPGIKAHKTLAMTGTPIPNRPVELWPIANNLAAGEFGSWVTYVREYCAGKQGKYGWEVSGASNLDVLQQKLRSTIMVRRKKEDVLKDLPPKIRQVITLPANGCSAAIKAEKLAWQGQADKIAVLEANVELAKAESDKAYGIAVEELKMGRRHSFEEIAKARRMTAEAKVPYVIEHVQSLVDSTGKVIMFAHHHSVIDALKEAFGDVAVTLTGKTSMDAKHAAVERFQNDDNCKVFIGSIKAAGVGLTLTAASNVVFAELDFVPSSISQCEDRAHRYGQLESVLVQHLVLQDSLDAQMAKTLVEKQKVIDRALDIKHGYIDDDIIPVAVAPKKQKMVVTKMSRPEITKIAESMTDEMRTCVLTGLQFLAGVCDGAEAKDGMGYNAFDAHIGHSLAHNDTLTDKQAALGLRLVKKYKKQLKPLNLSCTG